MPKGDLRPVAREANISISSMLLVMTFDTVWKLKNLITKYIMKAAIATIVRFGKHETV